MNGGQTCIAPDYILLDESIKSRFLELVKKQIKTFYGDDPSTSKDYERIVSERHVQRLAGLLRNQNCYYGATLPLLIPLFDLISFNVRREGGRREALH